MSANAIEIRGLTKSFGKSAALCGLDLDVPVGQVTGFLGPNGSGKSTTLRIVMGLLRADGGTAHVLGGDPWLDAVRLHRSIAYVPGDVNLWPNLTGGQALDILCRMSGKVDPSRKAALIERFELDPTKKARSYSRGNRQKVALIAALAADAELFVLDEPTAGLDPLMEAQFTECIREMRREGRSVLLSSHILDEVEKLADRVAIIKDGRTIETGTIAELRHLTRTQVIVTLTDGPGDLATRPGVHDLTVANGVVTFAVDGDAWPEILTHLSTRGPSSLVATPPSLEELFLRHYAAGTDEAAEAGSP